MRLPRILIAEDVDEQRELLRIKLRDAPFRVEYADDGEVAVKMFADACAANDPFDLFLLDGAMPNLSGLGAAEKIIAARPSCGGQVYFLTNLPVDDPTLNLRIRMMNLNPRKHILSKNDSVPNLIAIITGLLKSDSDEEVQNYAGGAG